MTITVKFFASLRETTGLSEISLSADGIDTATDVWNKSTNNSNMPPNTLIAINMDYVDASRAVNDNDEIAFFPPVSGG